MCRAVFKEKHGTKGSSVLFKVRSLDLLHCSESYRCKKEDKVETNNYEACLMGSINEYPLLQNISKFLLKKIKHNHTAKFYFKEIKEDNR